jgi:uncharacterized protein
VSAPTTISTAGLAPGVRFQWITRPSPPGSPRTDIAGFVGIAERGDLHTPARIESPAQFTSTFGRALPDAYLTDAVNAFFVNGGTTCWVVRAADPDQTASATLDLSYADGPAAVQLYATSPGTWAHRLAVDVINLGGGRFTLSLSLADEGLAEQWRGVSFARGDSRSIDTVLAGSTLVDAWILDDRISATTGGSSDAARVDLLDRAGSAAVRLELRPPQMWQRRVQMTVNAGDGGFDLQLLPVADQQAAEVWPGLSLDPGAHNYIVGMLAPSALVTAIDLRTAPAGTSTLPAPAGLARTNFFTAPALGTGFSGGADGVDTLMPAHLSGEGAPAGQRWGLATFESIDEISIVAIPDASHIGAVTAAPVIELSTAMIRHCVQMQDRIAVLDPPSPDQHPDDAVGWRAHFTSSYAALYFPWLLTVSNTGEIKPIPPSGAVAGIMARVSLRDSVAKPPANEAIDGAAAVCSPIDDLTHGRLNDYAVNAIRVVPGRGIRVLGARTCLADPDLAVALAAGQPPAPPAVSGLSFVNVRRLVTMVEAVVTQRLRERVFDANGPATWTAIERSVRFFLDDLWRAGGLDGASAAEAYLVECDAATNPGVDIDQGRLTCRVGVRPPWPAEFVLVRVTASASGVQVQEGGTSA